MTITENLSGYDRHELFSVAKRENNAKRKGLLVNHLQGKHIPVAPSKALKLFDRLAQQIKADIKENEHCLVIGFAETATAIGAELAASLDCGYIHTTREYFPEDMRIADFSEEHSHACEQNLFSDKDIFKGIDRVIFAEDELTTGKTILNFINALKKHSIGCKFCAASIINGMNDENRARYAQMGIGLYSLVRTADSAVSLNTDMDIAAENDIIPTADDNYSVIRFDGYIDPRTYVDIRKYSDSCKAMAEMALSRLSFPEGCRRIDVIGTEECMYPALFLGAVLESKGFEVYSHSTTRSPIVPCSAEGYPLKSRCRLKSFYDSGRKTFIYDLFDCDMTILVTDAKNPPSEIMSEFASLMRSPEKIFVLI